MKLLRSRPARSRESRSGADHCICWLAGWLAGWEVLLDLVRRLLAADEVDLDVLRLLLVELVHRLDVEAQRGDHLHMTSCIGWRRHTPTINRIRSVGNPTSIRALSDQTCCCTKRCMVDHQRASHRDGQKHTGGSVRDFDIPTEIQPQRQARRGGGQTSAFAPHRSAIFSTCLRVELLCIEYTAVEACGRSWTRDHGPWTMGRGGCNARVRPTRWV